MKDEAEKYINDIVAELRHFVAISVGDGMSKEEILTTLVGMSDPL